MSSGVQFCHPLDNVVGQSEKEVERSNTENPQQAPFLLENGGISAVLEPGGDPFGGVFGVLQLKFQPSSLHVSLVQLQISFEGTEVWISQDCTGACKQITFL